MRLTGTRTRLRSTDSVRVALALIVALLGAQARDPLIARAEGLTSSFAIDDGDPERSVPTPQAAAEQPLQMGYWTMLITDRAHAASKGGDHASALKYYRALAKAVPDRAVSFRKLCEVQRALGDRPGALSSCRTALGMQGVTATDHAAYVRLVLDKPEPLSADEIADADAVIAHLQRALGAAKAATDEAASTPVRAIALPIALTCEIALRLQDPRRLGACSAALEREAPADPRAFAYRFALALARHDLAGARAELSRAEQSGLSELALVRMRQRLADVSAGGPASDRRPLPLTLILSALLALAALGAGILLTRRGARPRSA